MDFRVDESHEIYAKLWHGHIYIFLETVFINFIIFSKVTYNPEKVKNIYSNQSYFYLKMFSKHPIMCKKTWESFFFSGFSIGIYCVFHNITIVVENVGQHRLLGADNITGVPQMEFQEDRHIS